MADTGGSKSGLFSSILGAAAGANPLVAGAGAVSSLLSSSPTSGTGPVTTGAVGFGDFHFDASGPDPQTRTLLYGLAAVVGVMALAMLRRRRRA